LTTRLKTSVKILAFLLLLVFCQDLCGFMVALAWGVGVRDTDIEECSGASCPKAATSNVGSLIWKGVFMTLSVCAVLTCGDDGFVRHSARRKGCGTELMPFRGHFVVALEDESALLTRESMLDRERVVTTVAVEGKVARLQSIAQAKTVAKFLGCQGRAIEPVWHGCEPGSRF
jgi:hypothetical protein